MNLTTALEVLGASDEVRAEIADLRNAEAALMAVRGLSAEWIAHVLHMSTAEAEEVRDLIERTVQDAMARDVGSNR